MSDILEKIKTFAIEEHKYQEPTLDYKKHLEHVAFVLSLGGYKLPEYILKQPDLWLLIESLIIQLAYTHDLIEDTRIQKEDLFQFGRTLAEATYLISDVPSGINRKTTKELTHVKISTYDHLRSIPELLVLIVKPADRFSNWYKSFLLGDKKKIKMYRKEYVEFRKATYRTGLYDYVWEALDRLYEISLPKPQKKKRSK